MLAWRDDLLGGRRGANAVSPTGSCRSQSGRIRPAGRGLVWASELPGSRYLMVSPAHRFLHGLDFYASDLKQIWVLEGGGGHDTVNDTFFHDVYRGCVDMKTTLQLWAQESSAAPGDVVTVVLTRDARLDFSANTDPEAAQRAFAGSSRRPPKYGGAPGASAPATEPAGEETQAAAQDAADRVSAGLGSGQGLRNLLIQVQAAFQRGSSPTLVLIEDLDAMFRGMMARGETSAAHDLVVAARDLINVVKAGRPGRVLVLLDPLGRLFQDEVLEFSEDARRTVVPGPSAHEIHAALARASRRIGFSYTQCSAVSEALVGAGTLNEALQTAVRAFTRSGTVDLESILQLPDVNDAVVDEVLRELDALVGLDGPDGLKAKIRGLLGSARSRRRDLVQQGKMPTSTLHMVLEGNPGTGKTTVARLVGRLFHALGLLPRDSVENGEVSKILGVEIGRTRENMRALLTAAQGGVLFIDEAHQLAEDNGIEAVKALVPFAEDHRADTVVILAGYGNGMRELMSVDPGMPSRFSNSFRIDDYGDEDLWQMLARGLEADNWSLAPGVEPRLRRLLSSRKHKEGCENGRGVRNLRDDLVDRHLDRGAEDRVISMEDLPLVAQSHPKELAEAQAELGRLVGLGDLRALLDRFRVNVDYALAHAEELPSMQGLRFVGPPGTGKTTVARLLARYLYGLGAIDKPEVVETTGVQLKAAYQGQTAPKVVEVFDRARGGVLFIDEAFGVAGYGRPDSYSGEAITTLLSELTRPQNVGTVVVVAGYEDHMDEFIALDPGLTRRFPTSVRFAGFTPDQLLEVADAWMGAKGWRRTDGFAPLFLQVATQASAARDFGNAGWVEIVTRSAVDVMKARVMRGRGEDGVITADDLTEAIRTQWPTLLPEASQPQSVPIPESQLESWSAASVQLAEPQRTALDSDSQTAEAVAGSTLPVTAILDGGRQATGTGFLIAASGAMATAAHVVSGARAVHVRLPGLVEPVIASVAAIDEVTDTAILQVGAEHVIGIPPLALGQSIGLLRAQRLVVAGYNQTTAEEDCHTVSAAVTRNSPERDPVYFNIDCAVEYGASGGPVFDPDQGAVVGLVHGGLGTTVKMMVRVEQIYLLLERHGWTNPRDDATATQPRESEVPVHAEA